MLLRSNCSLPSHQSYWPLSWTPVTTVLSTLNDHVLAALVNNCLTFVYLVRSLHCYVLIGVDDSLIHLILWNECLCQNYGVLNLYCKNVSLFPYICLPLSIIPTGVLHFQKALLNIWYNHYKWISNLLAWVWFVFDTHVITESKKEVSL